MKRLTTLLPLLLWCLMAGAQGMEYEVDWSEAESDGLLPHWSISLTLPDSMAMQSDDWKAVIEYPELEVIPSDAAYYPAVTEAEPGEWPDVHTHVGTSARRVQVDVDFLPVLYRDGNYQRILSFTLRLVPGKSSASGQRLTTASSDTRWAPNSLLAQGHWEKVGVKDDGLYELTKAKLASMGFKDPSHVRVFGYGGHLLPEYDLAALPDDLPEVPVYHEEGRIVFYGLGTVSWASHANGVWTHTQNHYATMGCYFLTDNDSLPAPTASCTVSSMADLLPKPTGMAHALYEKEDFAMHPSGRKLFDGYNHADGAKHSYTLELPGLKAGETASVTIAFAHSHDATTSVSIVAGDNTLGTMNIPANSAYCDANVVEATFTTRTLTSPCVLTLTHNRPAGVSGRVDFIRISYPADTEALRAEQLASVREPVLLGTVAPQNLHATPATDYIIVVPASGKLTAEAERLAEAHRSHDGLSVKVVRADEIYNEFSSGTPDATAIRRFMKMLYDRANTDDELPRYLLLMGDGAWDNRMLTANWKGTSPDDYLPCFESVNSVSSTRSFVMEDYFGLLDDNEGRDLLSDKPDIGVGRLPVSTPDQAREVVDKTIAYMSNAAAGAWRNTIVMLGDDGDNNQHMYDAEFVAAMVDGTYPQYMLKRIYWDTFPMETAATGNRYPAVHQRIMEILDEGALMVNYSGHGSADVLSHELVVDKNDIASVVSPRLPLWVTASCDISPFDNTVTSFGECALLNPKGGAIALFTTARTVFSTYNRRINYLFTKYVLARDEKGRRLRVGDAVRKAKSEIVSTGTTSLQDFSENKLHYVLLGDPALCIGQADYKVVVDRVDGQAVDDDADITLHAGAVVKVNGHVNNADGALADGFNGTIHPTVLDNRETVVGRNNNGSATSSFSYTEHAKVLFEGSDSVRSGRFEFVFRVPMDINYSGESGMLNLYAISNAKDAEAQGYTDAFLIGGTQPGLANDSTGPSIALYLNTPQFVSGDKVNETPLLVASLEDADGINTVGGGIGHDLTAVVDGSAALTYRLNNFYTSAFGDYTRGTLAYSLPALPAGKHTLALRAWDMMNNSSTATIDFEVVEGLTPGLTDITVTDSPARTETTFVVTHDRPGTAVTFRIEVSDLSGRVLWSSTNTTATTSTLYTQPWDLCDGGGTPLSTGVYLYRVTATSATGTSTSQSRKMVIKR